MSPSQAHVRLGCHGWPHVPHIPIRTHARVRPTDPPLQVHPDLFTHYPQQKGVNQESFSRFQAFLDDVRDKHTAPPRAGMHSYKFYLKCVEWAARGC